jgi:hypothetical protein
LLLGSKRHSFSPNLTTTATNKNKQQQEPPTIIYQMVATSWDPKVQEEFPEAKLSMDGNSIVCDTCTKQKRKEVKINCQQPYKAAQYKTHCNSKGHLDAMMDSKKKKQGSPNDTQVSGKA